MNFLKSSSALITTFLLGYFLTICNFNPATNQVSRNVQTTVTISCLHPLVSHEFKGETMEDLLPASVKRIESAKLVINLKFIAAKITTIDPKAASLFISTSRFAPIYLYAHNLRL